MSTQNTAEQRAIAGRTVCITGASSGIGKAIAAHLGSLGAHVYMMGRTAEPMERTAAHITDAGGQADVAVFDVADSMALIAWIEGAAAQTGRLDVMINNAGFGDVGTSLLDGDHEMWRGMLDVNVMALAVGSQTAVRTMRAKNCDGNLINISSIAALRRDSGFYGATKHAVNAINATLRAELQDDPIRITTIMPGVFATNFSRNADAALIEGLASMAGLSNVNFDEDGKLAEEHLDEIQQALKSVLGNVDYIAKAVEYVLTQPIDVNIEELVIRPPKSLF